MTERFSMREVLKSKSNVATDKITKVKVSKPEGASTDKVKSDKPTGKYKVKVVGGVKYMVLK
jgi:hypothetical protein